MTGQYPHPSLEFLRSSTAFACFAQIWWNGAGIDSITWSTDALGSYRRVFKTGETYVVTTPNMISQEATTKDDVSEVIRQFEHGGIRDVKNQKEAITFAHSDHWFGVKKNGELSAYWLQIAGMLHRDPKGNELGNAVAELWPPEF